MPPKSRVSVEDAVNVLLRYISYFASDQLPDWSSDIWHIMSKEPEFVAREQCGYFHSTHNKNTDCDDDNWDDDDWDDDEDEEDDEKRDPDYFNYVYSKQQKNHDTFDVKFSRHLWNSINKIAPIVENKPNTLGLQPKVWTDVLALEFWKQYRLKCAFVFKKATIQEYGNYYLTIFGRCKAKTCKKKLFGYVEENPGDYGDVIIKINCRDTRFERHEDCKRPLQGKRRDEMKKEVKEKGVKGSNLDAAQKLLQPGDTQCPVMSRANVLYQLKKESIEKIL
ncbi:unnamed protein product [Pieris macdunnoughi]|uniref:Uncharacterized protein n=1 Tax=Pieris macdunnoughi TaxID=345717 RepID=A0A821XSA5_9NEOP|nr:unnamed protein product [Pieris macdunnoughi]